MKETCDRVDYVGSKRSEMAMLILRRTPANSPSHLQPSDPAFESRAWQAIESRRLYPVKAG